MEDERKIP
jgi:hypothetical protein